MPEMPTSVFHSASCVQPSSTSSTAPAGTATPSTSLVNCRSQRHPRLCPGRRSRCGGVHCRALLLPLFTASRSLDWRRPAGQCPRCRSAGAGGVLSTAARPADDLSNDGAAPPSFSSMRPTMSPMARVGTACGRRRLLHATGTLARGVRQWRGCPIGAAGILRRGRRWSYAARRGGHDSLKVGADCAGCVPGVRRLLRPAGSGAGFLRAFPDTATQCVGDAAAGGGLRLARPGTGAWLPALSAAGAGPWCRGSGRLGGFELRQ